MTVIDHPLVTKSKHPVVSDLYQSHRGKGKGRLMKVIAVTPEHARCVHLNQDGEERGQFTLPLSFFESPSCGWWLVDRLEE